MKRNRKLDAYRGFSLLSMLLFHGYYDLVYVFAYIPSLLSAEVYTFWQQTIVLSFIFIAGAATCYGSRLCKRGIEVSLWGGVITAVTMAFLPSETIVFGVLSFLGLAMLLMAPFNACLKSLGNKSRWLPVLGALNLLGFALTQGLNRGYLGMYAWRLKELSFRFTDLGSFILGLPTAGFVSADYVPVLPHIFMFFLGRCIWQYYFMDVVNNGEQCGPEKLLAKVGQHSLIFYLVHQIILYGIIKIVGVFL